MHILMRLTTAKQQSILQTSSLYTIAFRTADGTTYRNPALHIPMTEVKNILKKARDWTFLMDEEHKPIVFPPEIAETAKRPDITIYSATTKHAIIIELTVPSEENLANAYVWKKC